MVLIPAYRTLDRTDPVDISAPEAVRALGLKLASKKALIEILKVDHVEKPTEN